MSTLSDTFHRDLDAVKILIENGADEAEALLSEVLDDFFTALKQAAAQSGPVLLEAATSAVAAAAATSGPAGVVLAAAENAVIGTLEMQGLPILRHAVTGAVAAAVANLQSASRPSGSAPSAG